MANPFTSALRTLRDYRRSYLAINALYYGVIGVGALVAVLNPELQAKVHEAVEASLKNELTPVVGAYESGLLPAIAMTFGVNFLIGSVAFIGLPSLIAPFSGLLLGTYRAVLWGLIFAPQTLEWTEPAVTRSLLVGLLMFLEGQGYVLAMHAAWVQGKSLVNPASVGATSRWEGYRRGVSLSMRLYLLVAAVLAVAAVYEAIIVIEVMGL